MKFKTNVEASQCEKYSTWAGNTKDEPKMEKNHEFLNLEENNKEQQLSR